MSGNENAENDEEAKRYRSTLNSFTKKKNQAHKDQAKRKSSVEDTVLLNIISFILCSLRVQYAIHCDSAAVSADAVEYVLLIFIRSSFLCLRIISTFTSFNSSFLNTTFMSSTFFFSSLFIPFPLHFLNVNHNTTSSC